MTNTSSVRVALFAAVIISLPIAACSLGVGTTGGGTQVSSVSSSETAAVPTPNVHYSGALDRLELSSFMQGTHKLTLDDGQMILLESSDANLDLDAYIGKSVEAHGSVQPTVEAGGTLMRVTEISILTTGIPEDTSSSSAGNTMCGGIAGIPCEEGMTCIDDASDSCDPKSGGADCSGICVSPIVVSSTSSVSLSSTSSSAVASSKPMSSLASSLPASSPSSSVSSASSSSSFSSLSSAPNSIMEQQIKTMASQVYDDASLWTQKYCTSHVGFCIPVHKNWYFKSFGATTTNLWHVEFGMTTIDALGDGAMILNLVSGTSSSMLAADGQIKTQGSDVIGFKDWADGKHFEIIADQRLRKAVEYMISQITSYELAQ